MGSELASRNAVTITGAGPPILLAHGYGCDQSMWNKIEPLLVGHQLIRYDLTGMGASDYSAYNETRYSSLEAHADDLVAILRELEADPVVAVGHSVSSTIVALAANQAPELFRGLVMLGPNPCYINDPPYEGGFSEQDIEGLLAAVRDNYTGWAGQLASMVSGEDLAAKEVLNERFCRNDPQISEHFARVTFTADNRADLEKIQHPTLIVQVSDDHISPAEVGRFVHDTVGNSKLVEIEATGHAPHMTHPQETAAAIMDFTAGL